MLEPDTFKSIIENAPLVSIDICLVYKGKILLGRRNNEPLKGEWFTPGGRIFKNEPWQECIRRVVGSELGITIKDPTEFKLMGVWDHFYSNSVFDESISTHYVNLPHFACFKSMPLIVLDDQHVEFDWFDLQLVATDERFHPYMKNFAEWLITKVEVTLD